MNSCTLAFLNSNGKNLSKKVVGNSFHSTGIGSAYLPSTGYTRCEPHPTTGVAGKMFIDSPERNSAFDYKAIANDIFRANVSYYGLLFHVRPYCPAAIPSRLKNSTSETVNVLFFFWEAEDLAEVEAQLDADLKANGGATKDKNQIDVVNNTRIRRALRRVSFTILKISDVDSVDRSTHSYSKDGIPDAQDVVRVDLVGDAVSIYHYGQGQAYAMVTGRNSFLRSYHLYILSIAALGIVDLLYGLSGDCFLVGTFKTVIILRNQKNVDLAVEIHLRYFFCLQQHGPTLATQFWSSGIAANDSTSLIGKSSSLHSLGASSYSQLKDSELILN
ncbi:hypothetical protein BC332_01145 [Capsicum chinense]|nr:hypothetical protein BC332_01145 [Capsicum chinense]